MKFESPRFGEIEVDDSALVHFACGLPGFPECREFVVMDHDNETPLRWLQCVGQPEIAFLVVEPEWVVGDYGVDVPESALEMLGYDPEDDQPSDIGLFLILNTTDGKLTANLRAPVAVHTKRRRALQLILEDNDLSVSHLIEAIPD